MELWELIARERIRETIGRYAHCADGGRFDALADLFIPDGVLEIPGQVITGRAAIRAFLGGTKSNLAATMSQPLIRHHVSSVSISILTPERAEAVSYFLAITAAGPDHWGRYRDELVPTGEEWLFRRRRVRRDGYAPGSWIAARERHE